MTVVEFAGVTKRFGARAALRDVSFALPAGSSLGLLGPNGAGKTTTLRVVAGLLRPDRGTVRVMGHDVARDPIAAKRVLAFLPDDPLLYGKLYPLEYLEFVAGLWRIDPDRAAAKAEELLGWLDLETKRSERIEAFSRGMRQKLALAGALIHDPDVMILDEPLTGLDAATARQVKDLLLQRVKTGKTVILTTHVLEIAERLAQRISIIDHGRIVAEGTLEELRQRAHSERAATLEDVFLELTRAADA